MSKTTAIVLAAGKGTRMKSELPKVLVPVCGRPMIQYVLDALAKGGVSRVIVVVGYRADLVRDALDGRGNIEFALQSEQLGTGHAVMTCRELLADCDDPVLIVTGDAPLMQADSVAALLDDYRRSRPVGGRRQRSARLAGAQAMRGLGRQHLRRPCRGRSRIAGHGHRRITKAAHKAPRVPNP